MRAIPSYLFALAALCLVGTAAVQGSEESLSSTSNVRARASRDIVTGTMTITATQPTTPTAVATRQLPTTATIQAAIRTATAARAATSGTLAAATETAAARATVTPTATATATTTPTLGSEWGGDALCRCHVPPLPPGSPECERLKAAYVATVVAAWASQTALARGTDTPTAPATDTPTATSTPTPRDTPRPTWTPEPTPTWLDICTTGGRTSCRAYLPFAFLRRVRR